MRKITRHIADYFRETDKLLLMLCTIASIFGCLLIYSVTHTTGTGARHTIVQATALLLGLTAAVVVSLFNYAKITRYYLVYALITVALLVVTWQFGYTPVGSDNQAWIELPFLGMSMQPSEIIKIFMILTFAHHVSSIKQENINKFSNILLLSAHAFTAPALIMIMQRDLGNVSVMLLISFTMLFASGIKARYFIIGLSAVAASSPLIWFFGLTDFQRDRFSIILDLNSDPLGFGYQQLQSLQAIGSGGIFGQGYLQGVATQSRTVPKAYNDFILTVAGEELGLLGCLLVFAVLTAIMIRIIYVATASKDRVGMIICAGAFGMFAAQTLVNAGMVLAVLPVIGVTLPFFSAGGTSLISLFIGIGLVTAVYKQRHSRTIYLR